ncbi:MAG: alpha-ketoglutarate-dependent dioxygenase AlkB [Flavobacteriaceae bacterium]|nr:alpha-ketoglutarate-dependent dioxygenase AlkB [Flavobacteriaceae bacterium]
MNLFDQFGQKMIHLPLEDAEITYYPSFIPADEAINYFEQLFRDTPWQQDDIRVFGKVYAQPRLTALYGEEGKSYSYSGFQMNPLTFTPLLLELKEKIEAVSHVNFTTVLLNLYRNGMDSNGWHSDDEKELGRNPIIASLSFGVTRRFHLRHRNDKSKKFSIDLEHGSLLIMKGETQHNWHHQLPKSRRIQDPRINLTFRIVKS